MMRGMNMQQMMKQAQKMQKQMMAEQEELAAQTFTGEAPNGMVKATFSGDKQLTDLQIKPDIVDPEDTDMLQDMVLTAINDGLAKVDQATQAKMGKYTRGLGL